MKKLNLLYIIFCFSFIAQAQLQEENFDAAALPEGWSVSNTISGCSWEFGYTKDLPFINPANPVKLPTGSVIFNDNKCGSFKNNVVSLEGPEVNLVEKAVVNAEIQLTYNHQAFVGSGKFMVDVWDGANWQTVLTVETDSPAKNSEEMSTKSTIDISDYVNSAFKVRFVYDDENTRTYGVAIDDYKLINTNESLTDQILNDGLIHFPNPVIDDLNFYSGKEIEVVDIYNVLGQRVYVVKPSSLSPKVNMSHLPSGTYVVNVLVGTKTSTIKILKQ